MCEQWPGDDVKETVIQVYSSAGDERFVFGVQGWMTIDALIEIDDHIQSGDYDDLFEEDGLYLCRVINVDYGDEGGYGWELTVIERRPIIDPTTGEPLESGHA
jgi:hypothetical protein